MKTNYKLDRTFGPVGSFAGKVVFVAGVILVWYSWFSIIHILLGALLAFSYSQTDIDFELKKVRHSDHLFGIIRTGKWIKVKPGMKIGILKSRKTWKTFSAGNRQLDNSVEDFRLVLFNSSGIKILPLKKAGDINVLRLDQELFCKQLQINKL